MNTRIARPRILRSNAGLPLTLDQVRTAAPAVFQESAAPHMSEQYAYIPTIRVLEVMLNNGFQVYEVAQSRPHKREKEPFVKHMLRLRYPEEKTKKVGDVVPELVLVNAHDGSACYYLYGGLFRYICANGLVIGETFSSMVVRHTGGAITAGRVLEGSYEVVNDQFPKITAAYNQMKKVVLDAERQVEFATKAMSLRYSSFVVFPFDPKDLLVARRQEDEGPTLWNVFNRVQENVMEGGAQGTALVTGRRTNMRPVEQVGNRIRVNRGLWDAAMEMLS